MSAEYLDSNGTLYFWQKIKNIFAQKSNTVSNITRNGTTFTATRADGTTFTFDQQDDTSIPASSTPQMDGIGAVGSSIKYAREDHVHPSDTSKLSTSLLGVANGVCPLNASSIIDSQYLPSFVDDIIEAYARSGQTELSSTWLAKDSADGPVIVPESGKIYILMNSSTNYSPDMQFRWGGSSYARLLGTGLSPITNAEIDIIVAS